MKYLRLCMSIPKISLNHITLVKQIVIGMLLRKV